MERGLGMGGAVKYSILKAEGNAEKAREYIAAATWLMLLFSVIFDRSGVPRLKKAFSLRSAHRAICSRSAMSI